MSLPTESFSCSSIARARSDAYSCKPARTQNVAGLNMHTPNPRLGLAYVAGEISKSGFDLSVIDAVGEDLDRITRYKARGDLMVEGLSVADIVAGYIPRLTLQG